MSFANLAYLTMVVAAFSSFALVLFYGSVRTSWSEWFPRAVAAKDVAPAPPAKADDYAKAA